MTYLVRPATPSLTELLHSSAERRPDAVAIAEDGTDLTYAQLWTRVRGFARSLAGQGIGPGSRVLVTVSGAVRTAVSVYAVSQLGATVSVIGDRYSATQRAMIEQDYAPHLILTGREEEPVVEPGPGGEVEETGNPELVIYTSGSSGRPGGVICHREAVTFSVDAIQRRLGYRLADRVLAVPPFSFDYGLYQLFLAVASGATLVAATPGDALATFAGAGRSRPTVLPILPALARSCLSLAARWPASVRDGVRLITSTGAHWDDDTRAALRALFPRAGLVSMYGLTECKRTTISAVDEDVAAPGTVGRPLPGTRVWIERQDGRPAAPGEVGQVVVSGPHVMRGYWNDPVRTRATFQEREGVRVLLTGDDGRLDAEGRLYVHGRRDGQVKIRGTRVSTAEIERAAAQLDSVSAAALVVGPRGGEPVLYVEGTAADADIRRRLGALVGVWKVPNEIRVLDRLPVNDRGKVDLAALRER
ncbi:Acyl-CoA synthetase (AMP-forming)/AMP-acid ligase II [Amycolatopsis xylanica]|uniref:Acyl-CoA synthetase (AMP-forming)/AMP-acid ligase II n=1 Tax=Amycolatopsis xylanica TaxID=589385 RepID=A0A1H3SC98_9PSEU|nr:AMP-binding protein [Amycolatopsis xylanica]SDZ35646.1 Acyl-CoA synthetase (AMP-forming)/AMP-acid ligase II [Amycolatopsis xylanica]